MYVQYKQICYELGLTPLPEKTLSGSGTHAIDEYEIKIDGVVIAYFSRPKKYKSPCVNCFEVKYSLADASYESNQTYTPLENTEIDVTRAFAEHHGIPFAYSSAFPDQPWSVVFPILDCPCFRRIASTGIDTYFEWYPTTNVGGNPLSRQQKTKLTPERTAGERRLDPESFVANHRYAVGFASIMGNPAHETDGLVHLISGPIFTGSSPEQIEVAGGKGFSISQAGASWMGEGLERYYLTGAYLSFASDTKINYDDWMAAPFSEAFGLPTCTPEGILIKQNSKPWVSVSCENLTAGGTEELPTSLVGCPDVPAACPTVSPTQSSTNGAATGATVEDATLQGILELIERDTFWFHIRTGSPVKPVSQHLIPSDISHFISSDSEGEYFIHLLPTPFPVHVAQVTYVRHKTCSSALSRTARGTGTSHSLTNAVSRAFAECRQMLSSLDTGQDISPSAYDMREVWFTGRSVEIFTNFFDQGTEKSSPEDDKEIICSYRQPIWEELVSKAGVQGVTIYRKILKNDSTTAVVKMIGSLINSVDGSKYSNNKRFVFFKDYLGYENIKIKYNGSTFM